MTIAAAMTAALLPTLQVATAPAASAATVGAITLHVQSARSVNNGPGFVHKGDAVTHYKWLINKDDTGDPGTLANQGIDKCLPSTATGGSTNPQYADTCPWPSTRKTSGFAPIVAQGDQTDLSDAKSLQAIPAGKYLISVTADGFKIDGAHFTISGGTQTVTVAMNPTPLPLSTLKLTVFNDNAPVDATYEVDAEPGLAGFIAHITDVFGPVSVDYYGNPICSVYLHRRPNGNTTSEINNNGSTNATVAGLPIAFGSDNRPILDPKSIGRCVSDNAGLITIPNLGPDRYAATVTPPVPAAGQTYQWVQTTTLEGGHDYDIWEQEGSTGYDTEQTKGAELVPAVQFGFVRTQAIAIPRRNVPTGEVKGVVVAGLPYVGGQNGQVVPETGFAGAKFDGPIKQPWVALSNLGAGDQQVYVGRGAVDGSFDIKNVPNGSYQLTVWDDDQDYIIWSFNVEVSNGGVTDVGNKMIVGWFTHVHGKIFVDTNGNGKMDPGEKGVPLFALTLRERDNSTIDQGTNTVTTDDSGSYDVREAYPLGKWLVLEAFNTRYRTTGITYQGANDLKATTKLGTAVDVNFLPIIGLGGEIDWGVEPYNPGSNGGIVGTVSYDTTRNELDPADAVSESYQPGIPGVPVHLYASVPCKVTDPAVVANECRQGKEIVPLKVRDPNAPAPSVAPSAAPSVAPSVAPSAAPSVAPSVAPSAPATVPLVDNPAADRGAFVKGPELADSYTSEEWAPPRGCTAKTYDGQPLTDQMALPAFGSAANTMCVEAPMMGVATGPSDATPGAFSQTVNGNYGFSASKLNLYAPGNSKNPAPAHDLPLYANLADNNYPDQDLTASDYIVSVDIPKELVDGKPMYKVTSEADVNIFTGDTYLPQQNYPPTTLAQANDPAGPPDGTPMPPSQPPSEQAGIISPCVGALHTVHVTNPDFLAGGGSPFEGQDRPSCSDKLVSVRAGQATAPNFNLFTDVPIPVHFWGLTLNDLGLTLDKRSVNYGEAQGLPYAPVGLYDWSGRLVDTTHTDFNGLYEALEPSTDTYNCPVPAGPCPNMYRFVGNDPGQPGHLNADYQPRFRTIATNFQGWPGQYTVTDEAPTQAAATALAPDTTVANPTVCNLADSQPQLLATDHPYLRKTGSTTVPITLTGSGFGTTGTLKVGTATPTIVSWGDKQIVFRLPSTTASGSLAVSVVANGLPSVNGLTFQMLDAGSTASGQTANNPQIAEVGPGKQFATIQSALEFAKPTAAVRNNRGQIVTPAKPYWLVVVWPNTADSSNPKGEYTENLIVHHAVRIQGVGPGGFDSSGSFVPGAIVDGSGFSADNPIGTNWIALLSSLRYDGDPAVPDAAVVTFLDDPALASVGGYQPAMDGFSILNGSQSDFAGNVNEITGGFKTPYGATGALVTQGGGIYVHNNVRNLHVTDNLFSGDSGSYGGAIRVGTPYVGDNRNYGLVLSNNQIRDNGGTNLAGGIGLFTGSDGYQVTNNYICGNFSAEYGGAISAFGYQVHPLADLLAGVQGGGKIANNRIWFNQSYDEGGAIMIAGELPANPNNLSEGSGPVAIDSNVIQANLANDDGGGIRLLQTSGSHVTRANPETITITNNTIANNVSAHEGGGIALDDAAFVNIVNNTVAKNMTTATAVTSDGSPAPAGLSTADNSAPLQARLQNSSYFSSSATLGTTTYSKPTLLNNVFNDNRAGSFSGGLVTGISAGDANAWDMGNADHPTASALSPRNSVLQTTVGTDVDPANPAATNNTVTSSANFTDPYDVTVNVLASRLYPAFRQAVIVAEILPPSLMGNYHLKDATSPAWGRGAANLNVRWGPGASGWNYNVNAATPDIDGDVRPGAGRPLGKGYDAGSDQLKP